MEGCGGYWWCVRCGDGDGGGERGGMGVESWGCVCLGVVSDVDMSVEGT